MIETLLELAWGFGPELAGLGVLGYVVIWLRRLSVVATYIRIGALVGAVGLVGALVGVVNTGRALELAAAGVRALLGAVGAYGGAPA